MPDDIKAKQLMRNDNSVGEIVHVMTVTNDCDSEKNKCETLEDHKTIAIETT